MASFISTDETIGVRLNGVVSRTGGRIGNYVLESAGVAQGLFVVANGTAGEACELIDSAADVKNALGLTIYQAGKTAGDTAFYDQNEVVPVLEEGCEYVSVEGTVVAGQPVYARHTANGGNTTLGKPRADSDGNIVLDTTATTDGEYRVTLSNGVVEETFGFTASTSTADDIMTGLVAAIDASANFAATGTTEATITAQTGGEVSVIALDAPTTAALALYTIVDNQNATKVPGAYFKESRTGAGLVEIEVGRTAGKA